MKLGHDMDSVELRQTLHSVPEKSFAEYRTKEILEDWLRERIDEYEDGEHPNEPVCEWAG